MPDKNVRNVDGKPLVLYPLLAALEARNVNDVYISSDDDKILNVAEGLNVTRIKRPAELGRADTKHIDVIRHAVLEMKRINCYPDILVVLLANTVTVKSEWIDSCVSKILNDKAIDSVVPVYNEQDHHPFRAKTLDEDGYLKPWFDFGGEIISTNRQELPLNYFLGHNFWVINLSRGYLFDGSGQQPWTFLGNKIKPFLVDECFDVHCEADLARSKLWLEKNLI